MRKAIELEPEVPKSPPSFFSRIATSAYSYFDRSDERTKSVQDAALNVVFFGIAVWTMHRYGHKLAV